MFGPGRGVEEAAQSAKDRGRDSLCETVANLRRLAADLAKVPREIRAAPSRAFEFESDGVNKEVPRRRRRSSGAWLLATIAASLGLGALVLVLVR